MLWSNMIDVLRGGLFVLAGVFGGSLGTAILVASAAVRVALLPVTLEVARRRVLREREARGRQPAPVAVPFNAKDAVAGVIQLPLVAGLYAAIRGSVSGESATGFLWVRSLAKPDRGLALVAAAISVLIARATIPPGTPAAQVVPILVTATLTYVFLSHLGAGLALYSVVNSVANGVERMIAERTLRPGTA